jgi:hypothetical protein
MPSVKFPLGFWYSDESYLDGLAEIDLIGGFLVALIVVGALNGA